MRRSQRQTQASQSNYNECDSEEKQKALASAASRLVVYVLHNLDNSKILRRTQIQKHTAIKGVNWNKQLEAANKRLEEVYGCTLEVVEDLSVKQPSFYIKKLTPNIAISQADEDEKRKRLMTCLIMSIIFMSNGKCTETQLLAFFQKLSVLDEDDDDDLKDHLKELHSSGLVEIDNNCISWGPMAEVVVNKLEILNFVSKIYHTSAKSWGELHIKAVEQSEVNAMRARNGIGENGAESSQQ